ncbi:MAG: hypothetical protein AABM67_02990 [Acidobacteriota bacterium]
MNLLRGLKVGPLVFAFAVGVAGWTPPPTSGPFDSFGDINCEDEMAHLDNFAVSLQNWPQARGAIIFYGGKTFRGKLPRLGEAAARAARIQSYLVKRRGIPANQLIVIDGGYHKEFQVQLWIVPPGAGLPLREPTVPTQEIKFRKGKATPREYRCEI